MSDGFPCPDGVECNHSQCGHRQDTKRDSALTYKGFLARYFNQRNPSGGLWQAVEIHNETGAGIGLINDYIARAKHEEANPSIFRKTAFAAPPPEPTEPSIELPIELEAAFQRGKILQMQDEEIQMLAEFVNA